MKESVNKRLKPRQTQDIEHWREARLGEILPLKYGKARSVQFGYPRSNTPTFGSNGAFGIFERALTTKPALIVGRKGAAGAVHYSPEPCWPIDTAFYSEGGNDVFLPFFRYLLESLQLVALDRSTAIPSLSRDDYHSRIVRYPEAESEQRRIVAEIEKQFTRLDAGVAALRRLQANLKRYRAAVLKAACEGRLVPTEAELARKEGRSYETGEQLLQRLLMERRKHFSAKNANRKYNDPAPPHFSGMPSLPEGWTSATLDALADVKGGITKDQKRKHTVPARPVAYLRVANVQRGYLDLTEVKQIVAAEDEIQELALRPGDILFNEGGDRDKLGRGWIWSGQLPECIHQNHVFRARPFDAAMDPKFVSWYGNTFGQQFFFDEGKHTTNLASISMTKLRRLPVPIPPPAEQTRIVAEVERRLSVLDELEAVVSTNLTRATRLRQSILEKSFKGAI